MKINMSKVTAKLFNFMNMAYHGTRIVMLKSSLALADRVPHQVEKKRTLGLLAGQFTVPEKRFWTKKIKSIACSIAMIGEHY